MPAWPGGPCPDCGEPMPPNLITCQSCRALLNSDLDVTMVDIPEFIPLREISPEESGSESSSQIDAQPADHEQQTLLVRARGVYVPCPSCREELKIPTHYLNSDVRCNRCDSPFNCQLGPDLNNLIASYVDCPHCQKRIRADSSQTNKDIACEHCSGRVHISIEATQSDSD